jgi:hypothetical protein
MKPETEHKYHSESMESPKIVMTTELASSSVCTKAKTASAPPPAYTSSKPSSSVCTKAKTTSGEKPYTKTVEKPYTKFETKTVDKPYTKVETKTVEKPYTKFETKTVEKPYLKVETKTVDKPYTKFETKTVDKPYFKVETKTVEKPTTKTLAASTCIQAGPTDKPCSCKHEDDKPCSCKQKHQDKHEEEQHEDEHHEDEHHDETENKCPGYLSEGFEVCLPLPSPSHQTMTCPLTLPSQFPHLIIPVDSAKPKKSYHTSFNGTASGSVSSIFNFDIPASHAGKTCSLDFLFPEQSQLETSAFSMTGSGEVEFSILESACVQGTSYETKPKTHEVLATMKMSAGNSYHIHDAPCRAGQTVSIEMKPVDDTCFNYFQDFNPCPIGLYVNVE